MTPAQVLKELKELKEEYRRQNLKYTPEQQVKYDRLMELRRKRVKYFYDNDLVFKAEKDAIILHCLPAYRSKEITDEVFECKKNRIFDQAENRMHAQQALLSCILS